MATSNPSGEEPTQYGNMFAVCPKKDCPHVEPLVAHIENLSIDMSIPCGVCKHVGENWLCLTCSEVYCSRYVSSHMVDHQAEHPNHMIMLSFSDLSFWCYECDSYIESSHLKSIYEAATIAKFDSPTKSLKPAASLQTAPQTSGAETIKDGNEKDGKLCEATEDVNPMVSTKKDGDEDGEKSETAELGAKAGFHQESTLPGEVLQSRMRAVIYGNCIGDAIGLLTEFMTKEEANEIYGRKSKYFGLMNPTIPIKDLKLEYDMKHDDFHRSRWQVGDWTDDSDQMILILRTLVDTNGKADYLDFVQKFKVWTETGYKELGDYGGMGIGQTTFKVILDKDFLRKPHKSAHQVWIDSGKWAAPNGGVMRTSILGTQDFSDILTVIENTRQICKVTHADPRCIASCVAVTTAIALMLQGKHCEGNAYKYDVMAICEEAYGYACAELETPQEKEELRRHMFADNLAELELCDKIGYTYKCLGSGFWAFRQKDFRMALTELVMEAGDADTNGAVAGALLGCKLGVERLPETWLEKLLHKEWLENEIDRYFSMLKLDGK